MTLCGGVVAVTLGHPDAIVLFVGFVALYVDQCEIVLYVVA